MQGVPNDSDGGGLQDNFYKYRKSGVMFSDKHPPPELQTRYAMVAKLVDALVRLLLRLKETGR